ncbi:Conserved oligomeric Golgi complex subunit 5 [Dirofilaria immitis]|nr:Conserved oligomeric Golgi complex subunit 5 [Dirofilaria immitis]
MLPYYPLANRNVSILEVCVRIECDVIDGIVSGWRSMTWSWYYWKRTFLRQYNTGFPFSSESYPQMNEDEYSSHASTVGNDCHLFYEIEASEHCLVIFVLLFNLTLVMRKPFMAVMYCRFGQLRLFQFSTFSFLSSSIIRNATSTSSITKIAKENLNVGTIGHVDHGKTTLTAAITKILSTKGKTKFIKFEEIDKAKEEQRRGITINVAHIGYESDTRRYAHVDLIAATDGVMAQTKEHLLLAKQVGISNIVVFINKVDLVDNDVVTLVEIEARELLEHHGYSDNSVTVVEGSALQALQKSDGKCIEKLISALDKIPIPKRPQDRPFLMPIASRVSITGRGTVVVGTVEQGKIKKGDKVEIKGESQCFYSVVSDIQVCAGEHCGILCRGIKANTVKRGMWLGAVDAIITSNFFKVELYLLSKEEGGRCLAVHSGFTEKVFCSTWDQAGRLHLESDMLMPGEHCTAYLVLVNKMPVRQLLPFTMREGSKRPLLRMSYYCYVYMNVCCTDSKMIIITVKVVYKARKLRKLHLGRSNWKAYAEELVAAIRIDEETLLGKINSVKENIGRQIREAVEQHHPRLVEQASALQNLDRIQTSINREMSYLYKKCRELSERFQFEYQGLYQTTNRLEQLYSLRRILASANRCEHLIGKLESETELVKRSEIICELEAITTEMLCLKDLNSTREMILLSIPRLTTEARQNIASHLKSSLENLSAPLVSSCVHALNNLSSYENELNSSNAVASKLLPQIVNQIQISLEQYSLLNMEIITEFCGKLAKVVSRRISENAFYATRFVQLLSKILSMYPAKAVQPLDQSLQPLRRAVLSHALGRMFKVVEHAFEENNLPNFSVEKIDSAIKEELKSVEWDAELNKEMETNVTKVIQLIAQKIEQRLVLDPPTLQLSERLSTAQIQNYALVSVAHMLSLSWPKQNEPLVRISQQVQEALMDVARSSVFTILLSMHNEKLNNPSPYVRELCYYLRIFQSHSSFLKFAGSEEVLSSFLDYVIELFLLTSSLLRPLSPDQLSHLSFDLQYIADHGLSLYNVQSSLLPAMSQFVNAFKLSAEQLAQSESLPFWFVVQLLISTSEGTLLSPHISANWSLEEYLKWCLDHSSSDRLDFLSSLMRSYTSSVISSNRTDDAFDRTENKVLIRIKSVGMQEILEEDKQGSKTIEEDEGWESKTVILEIGGIMDVNTARQALNRSDSSIRRCNTENPILQISNSLFTTEWNCVIGTDMIFKIEEKQLRFVECSDVRLKAEKALIIDNDEKPYSLDNIGRLAKCCCVAATVFHCAFFRRRSYVLGFIIDSFSTVGNPSALAIGYAIDARRIMISVKFIVQQRIFALCIFDTLTERVNEYVGHACILFTISARHDAEMTISGRLLKSTILIREEMERREQSICAVDLKLSSCISAFAPPAPSLHVVCKEKMSTNTPISVYKDSGSL